MLVGNVVTGGAAQSTTAALTVNPLTPPVITTQPAGVAITAGQTATLSVVATGAPPLTYQWFQGQSGDTSTPVAGATAASLAISPGATTSYWVQVANTAGSVASVTATVTVNSPPTCTLAVQGTETSDFTTLFTVQAVATCTDPQGKSLTTSIDWGDGSPPATGPGGALTATHTYTAPLQSDYTNVVTATDALGLTGTVMYSTTLIPAGQASPVFSGQSSDFTVSLTSPSPPPPVQVTFDCTTVTDSTGKVYDASTVGISCDSTPAIVTLSSASQNVQIGIQTTGSAIGAVAPAARMSGLFYACCLPLPGWLLFRLRKRRSKAAGLPLSQMLFLAVAGVLAFQLTGCGGGFTIPAKNPSSSSTPAVNYQVTIVDSPVNPANVTGLVQIR